MIKKSLILLLSFLSIFLPLDSFAKKQEPSKVYVGLYVEGIRSLSYNQENFTGDLTVWFRWKDNDIQPSKTFKLKHAKINSQKVVFSGMINQGEDHLEIIDISATFFTKWDITHFPFDNQILKIQIEEDEDDPNIEVLYVSDDQNIRPSTDVEIASWKIRDEKSYVTCNQFHSNYGNPATNIEDACSTQFNHFIEIEKKSELIGFKLLICPIVAILLLALGLLLPPSEGARIGIPTTAAFLLISSQFILNNLLPPSIGYSFAEKLISFGLLQCLLLVIFTVLSVRYYKNNQLELSAKIDKNLLRFAILLDLAFTIYTAYVISL